MVTILKTPTKEDWAWTKICTLNTIGKMSSAEPSLDWKKKLIAAEHSPLRELNFGIKMVIPYWVSVHFVRHHIGVNHYVQSQRNDRQDEYDRATAPQGEMVSHIMSINAQELIFMARKRLCYQASPETRKVMEEICQKVIEICPEFEGAFEPNCFYRNGKCTEFFPCGYNQNYHSKN